MDDVSEKPGRLVVVNAPGISPAKLLEVTERLEQLAKSGQLPEGQHSVFYKHDPVCTYGHTGECNCTPEILFGPSVSKAHEQ